MKIHEYQGKELLKRYGVPVPIGRAVMDLGDVDGAVREVQNETGREVVVIKAQIHAGGRGKGGGVKVAKSFVDAQDKAQRDLRHEPRDPPDRARGASASSACSSSRASTSRASSTSAWSSTAASVA